MAPAYCGLRDCTYLHRLVRNWSNVNSVAFHPLPLTYVAMYLIFWNIDVGLLVPQMGILTIGSLLSPIVEILFVL